MFWLQESRWNYLFSFLALPAILQLCVLPFLPESPRFLLMERRDEAAAERGIACTSRNTRAVPVTQVHLQNAYRLSQKHLCLSCCKRHFLVFTTITSTHFWILKKWFYSHETTALIAILYLQGIGRVVNQDQRLIVYFPIAEICSFTVFYDCCGSVFTTELQCAKLWKDRFTIFQVLETRISCPYEHGNRFCVLWSFLLFIAKLTCWILTFKPKMVSLHTKCKTPNHMLIPQSTATSNIYIAFQI